MGIKLVGLDKLLKDVKKLDKKAVQIIQEQTQDAAENIEFNAKQLAPVDLGKLRQNIKALEVGLLQWKVLANAFGFAPYSAYIEFGTGGLVEVPNELKDQAIKFKGKGVKQINLRPQPYLYPAFVKGRKNYIKSLERELKRLEL